MYSTVQYSPVQYNIAQYRTEQDRTVRFSWVLQQAVGSILSAKDMQRSVVLRLG